MAPRKKPGEQARPVYLETTRPRHSQCQRCAMPVQSCYVKGTRVRLDYGRLTLAGEALALVGGARTFTEIALGHRVFRRRVAHIREGLPEYGWIRAEHRCGVDYFAHQDRRTFFDQPSGPECPF